MQLPELELPRSGYRTIIAFSDPGETELKDQYKEAEYWKWIERAGLQYMADYLAGWRNVIDFVDRTENVLVYFSAPFLGAPNSVRAVLISYAKTTVRDPDKLIYFEYPREYSERGGKDFSGAGRETTFDACLGDQDPRKTLVVGLGEFAQGCVATTLYQFNRHLKVPDENLYIDHHLSITPVPKDNQYDEEFLAYLQTCAEPFGTYKSVKAIYH